MSRGHKGRICQIPLLISQSYSDETKPNHEAVHTYSLQLLAQGDKGQEEIIQKNEVE
jgi:hypothetical protein